MDDNSLRDTEAEGLSPLSTETEYGRSYRKQVAIGCCLAAGMVLALGAWSVFDHVQAGGNWRECGVKIRIPWVLIDPEVRDAAKRFLEAKLSSSFDLRPRDTSLLVWSVFAAVGAGLVAYKLAWISFQVLMPLALLIASVGCILKFRLDPIWRPRGRDR